MKFLDGSIICVSSQKSLLKKSIIKGKFMFSQHENDKNGVNHIEKMPIDMMKLPIKFLDKPDEYAYISSCRFFRSVGKFDYDGGKLLQYVAAGDQANVRAMLLDRPALISYNGQVIDSAGRVFDSITPLQYAAWALDK